MDTFSVDECCAASGFPKGSLGAMVHRGYVPRFPIPTDDLLCLALARQLYEGGHTTAAACDLAWAARDAWGEVATAADALYLAIVPAANGFTWILEPGASDLTPFVTRGRRRGTTVVVDATAVVRDALDRLLVLLRRRDPAGAERLARNGFTFEIPQAGQRAA